jgi:hypothetical protein
VEVDVATSMSPSPTKRTARKETHETQKKKCMYHPRMNEEDAASSTYIGPTTRKNYGEIGPRYTG